MTATTPGVRTLLRHADMAEIGATVIQVHQRRWVGGPFGEAPAGFGEDEAGHADRLACMLAHSSRPPGPLFAGTVARAAAALGWCVARLGRRLIMAFDHLLDLRGIALYERLLAALPAGAAHDRANVCAGIDREQQHAGVLAAWRRGRAVA